MRITDLLSQNAVCLGASVSGREEALDRLIALQGKAGNLNDAARYRADLLAREKLGSTAIGNGIAVPHAKSGAVLRPGLAAMTVPGGVDFGAPDKAPSDLFFMIAAPEGAGDSHLEILSRLMVMLMDEPDSALDFVNRHMVLGKIREVLHERQQAGLITLHDPNFALSYCDRLLLMQDGTIVTEIDMRNTDRATIEAALGIIYGEIAVLEYKDRYIMTRR